MVQMMRSRPQVKVEAPDSCEVLHVRKPSKLLTYVESGHLLEEPSPLGLRLNKTPSFLDLIQMRLSQPNHPPIFKKKKDAADKLKASNFPASLLRIGSWEYRSRYEGDLVAKCYFAKHKLVWEMLDGGLKNKIEIQWSDIVAVKASYCDDGVDTLDVVLARQPLFFRETNPQPRKHTLWKATSDFTAAQASLHRRHFLQCSSGLLGKHFEKLVQCDPRLNFLSRQPEIALDSPYFEPRVPALDDLNESNGVSGLDIGVPATAPPAQTSSSPDELDLSGNGSDNVCRPSLSPSSVRDSHQAVEDPGRCGIKESEKEKGTKMRMQPSMWMSDLMSHIGHCISQQMGSGSGRDMMGEIAQYLFSDSEVVSASDERIMSRVNSLCCLLQKDFSSYDADEASVESKELGTMSRKDSIGDLLLNLPRIASFPQFVFSISEESDNHSSRN